MYWRGDGVAMDRKKFAHYTKLAADNGDADSIFNMGVIYENGDGVPRDIEQAMTYYKKAAKMGQTQAVKRLERGK